MEFREPEFLTSTNIIDKEGQLRILELPFEVKRVYFMDAVPSESSRGHHAHKSLSQIFFMVKGELVIEVSTPVVSREFKLSHNENRILCLYPGFWRILRNFSADANCLILASHHFDSDDYIRDYNEYEKWFYSEFADES